MGPIIMLDKCALQALTDIEVDFLGHGNLSTIIYTTNIIYDIIVV